MTSCLPSCMHYVITIELPHICVHNVFLYMLSHERIHWESQALSVSKLFTSLYWFSYITGLHVTQHTYCWAETVVSVCVWCNINRIYTEWVSVPLHVYWLQINCKQLLCVRRRSVRLHLPRAARISGIVKPFDQLWVRGHSDFNHVGVRFHLEGPIVSAKQMMQFHFLLQDGTLWGVINTLRMDPSSNIPGAKKKKKKSHLSDKWTISLSEWRLKRWCRNASLMILTPYVQK